MIKININKVYQDRINQIDKDVSSAISKKEWTKVAKLRAEKANLEGILEQKQ